MTIDAMSKMGAEERAECRNRQTELAEELKATGALDEVTYPHLRPAASARPEVSARMNVRDCDATLIVLGNQVRSHGASMSASCAAQRGRPLLMTTGVVREVLTWLATLKWPVVLNVTGPRESEQPGVRLLTQRLMHEVLAGAG